MQHLQEGNGDLKPDKGSSRPCFGVWKGAACAVFTQGSWQSSTFGVSTAIPVSWLHAPVHAGQRQGQQSCSQRLPAISSPNLFFLQEQVWCNTLGIRRLQKSAHLQIYCLRDWNLFPHFQCPSPPFPFPVLEIMKTLVFKFSCSSSPHRLIAQKKTYIYISKKPLGACVHKRAGR